MTNERLYTLDAMRGLAAVMVVLYHLSDIAFRVAPGGYLAVDFFFALSGLVLAQAYERPLREGLGARAFMLKRLVRLYPMFMLGVGFAVLKAAGQIVAGDPDALSPMQVAGALATEVFMLPSPVTGGDLFPLNGPAWSLFFELVINAAFAAWLVSMRSGWLRLVVIAAGVAVCAAAWQAGTLNVGWSWASAWGGLARVTFSFGVGVLIFRHGAPAKTAGWMVLAPMAALMAMMILPVASAWRPLYDSAAALIAAPAILVLGARLQPPRQLRAACEVLGDLSFPLYAVHFPLLFIAGFVARKLGLPPLVWVPALVAGLMLFAWLLGRFVDPILRRKLNSLLTRAPEVRAAP